MSAAARISLSTAEDDPLEGDKLEEVERDEEGWMMGRRLQTSLTYANSTLAPMRTVGLRGGCAVVRHGPAVHLRAQGKVSTSVITSVPVSSLTG